MSDRVTPRVWQTSQLSNRERIETLQLRHGMTLILSRIEAGDACPYHYIEPDDVFGIGFHLMGGSRFEMDQTRFETLPLDVWAGASPRGAGSSFTLPAHGFRTVSLRFSPDAARDLLIRHGDSAGPMVGVIKLAEQASVAARLAPLDPAAAQMVEAMFITPYTGAARTLFLESCALGLLAAQFDAVTRSDATAKEAASLAYRDKMLVARDLLDGQLADPPTIVALARSIGTNEFTLKRAFKETFGTTVFGYVRRRRIERAATELHDGLSVAAAAEIAGYECPRCFADAFRRHYGVLPSAVTRAAITNAPGRHG